VDGPGAIHGHAASASTRGGGGSSKFLTLTDDLGVGYLDVPEVSVTSLSRIVCAGSSLPESNVRANVGVTLRLPPGEPGVAVRLPAADVYDEVRNPQRDAEHERECEGSREFHCSAPFELSKLSIF
jgi:hypothetical protein